MKLFAVRLADGSLVPSVHTGEPVYFDEKRLAKQVRDRINEHERRHSAHSGTPYKGDCHVVLGPDHRRYNHNQ